MCHVCELKRAADKEECERVRSQMSPSHLEEVELMLDKTLRQILDAQGDRPIGLTVVAVPPSKNHSQTVVVLGSGISRSIQLKDTVEQVFGLNLEYLGREKVAAGH